MMTRIKYTLLILIVIFLGCKKDPPCNPDPVNHENYLNSSAKSYAPYQLNDTIIFIDSSNVELIMTCTSITTDTIIDSSIERAICSNNVRGGFTLNKIHDQIVTTLSGSTSFEIWMNSNYDHDGFNVFYRYNSGYDGIQIQLPREDDIVPSIVINGNTYTDVYLSTLNDIDGYTAPNQGLVAFKYGQGKWWSLKQ